MKKYKVKITNKLNIGFMREGSGRFAYVSNSDIEENTIKNFTDLAYKNKNFVKYDTAIYYSNIAGDIINITDYEYLVNNIKKGQTPKEKLISFFKELLENQVNVIIIDNKSKKIIQTEDIELIEKYVSQFAKNLIIQYREYDLSYDY